MECLQVRLDSYYKSKRTKQSLAKSSSSSLSKWPHPSSYKAQPHSLAEAGFYFDPSAEDVDNVTCFMCGKELSDWDLEDDPFEIHWRKCRNTCAWANARCGLIYDLDEDGNYTFSDSTRLPTSKALEKARLDTFAAHKSWPHDSVRGHGANSKKMAKAGFVYTPQSIGDDTATCLYCNLSLSGWDDEDDPTQEHLKRENKTGISCAFLRSLSGRITKQPSTRNVSKPPSQAMSVDSDDELVTTMAPARTPGAKNSSSRMTRSTSTRPSIAPAKTPSSRRTTRGTGTGAKTPASRTTAGSGAEETEGGSESDIGKRVSKSKRKGQAKTNGRIHVIEEEEEEKDVAGEHEHPDGGEEEVAEMEEVKKEKPKRGRPPKVKKPAAVQQDVPMEDMDAEPVPAKKAHARTRSRANLMSEPDAVMPPSKSSHSRTKSATKVAKATPVPEDAESLDKRSTAGTAKDINNKDGKDDGSELGDHAAPLTKIKAKATKVSRSKSKKVPESEPESEKQLASGAIETDQEHEEPNATIAEATGAPSTNNGDVLSRRSISSASDEAGYATAEPPRDSEPTVVDTDRETVPPSKSAQSQRYSHTRPSPRIVDVAEQEPDEMLDASQVGRVDSDSVMAENFPGATHASRLTASGHLETGAPRGSMAPRTGSTSSKGNATRASRASGSIASASKSGQRRKEKLKVVEVSSDGEEDEAPAASTHVKKSTRVSQKERGNETDRPAPEHPSSKGKKKVQVEIVIPVKVKKASPISSITKANDPPSPDIEMEEGTEPPPSSTTNEDVPDVFQFVPSPPQSPRGVLTPPVAPVEAMAPKPPWTPPAEDSRAASGFHNSPISFVPVMATLPIQKLTSLTEEENTMTVEQYIRREIESQYRWLKDDAERQLSQLREKAAETRRIIEAL